MVHFGPKLGKHGSLVNVPKWSKWVQKGPKWSTQVFLTIWDPFGRGHEMFHDDMIMYAIINDQQSVIAMITRSSS